MFINSHPSRPLFRSCCMSTWGSPCPPGVGCLQTTAHLRVMRENLKWSRRENKLRQRHWSWCCQPGSGGWHVPLRGDVTARDWSVVRAVVGAPVTGLKPPGAPSHHGDLSATRRQQRHLGSESGSAPPGSFLVEARGGVVLPTQ